MKKIFITFIMLSISGCSNINNKTDISYDYTAIFKELAFVFSPQADWTSLTNNLNNENCEEISTQLNDLNEIQKNILLSEMQLKATCLDQNDKLAFEYLNKANHLDGNYFDARVGYFYEKRIGVDRDLGKALDYYRADIYQKTPHIFS